VSQRNNSAEEATIVSRDCVIDVLRRQLHVAVKIERRFTVEQIAAESGVKVRAIRSYMSGDDGEAREPSLSAALSIAVVLGKRTVNAMLATIGYVGMSLEDAEKSGPAMVAAEAMCHLGTFARAAADNTIDHVEEPEAENAVDNVIELLTPFSSRGKAA
jgi:transcriptional regulator with XRE-family HTH domain